MQRLARLGKLALVESFAVLIPPVQSRIIDESLGRRPLDLSVGLLLSTHLADGVYCLAESFCAYNIVLSGALQIPHR